MINPVSPWTATVQADIVNSSLLFETTMSKLGVNWLPDALEPEYIYTLSADYSISKKIKFVAETYGFAQSHHHAQNIADIALLYLINDNMQLDLIAGSGIMHSHTEKFIEVGLSFRI